MLSEVEIDSHDQKNLLGINNRRTHSSMPKEIFWSQIRFGNLLVADSLRKSSGPVLRRIP